MTYNDYFLENSYIGDHLANLDETLLRLLLILSIWVIFNKRITVKVITISTILTIIADKINLFGGIFWIINTFALSPLGRETNNPQISLVVPLLLTTIGLIISVFKKWDVQKVFYIIISFISLGVIFAYHMVFVQGVLKSDIEDEFKRMESIINLSDDNLRKYLCHNTGYICFDGVTNEEFHHVEIIANEVNDDINSHNDSYIKRYNLLALKEDDKVFSYIFMKVGDRWDIILSSERVEKIHNAVKTYFYILASITHFIWIILGNLLLCYHNKKIYKN